MSIAQVKICDTCGYINLPCEHPCHNCGEDNFVTPERYHQVIDRRYNNKSIE